MFQILKLASQVLLNPYKIVDKASCRTFLIEFVLLVRTFAAKSETQLDDAMLKVIEIILNNDALFDYVFQLISDQFQTNEILFESADEKTIVELIEKIELTEIQFPEAINPVLVISLISQIISIINIVKNK
jgi:hypothetical protein